MLVLLTWGQASRTLPGLEAIREVDDGEWEKKGNIKESEVTEPREEG